MKHFCLSVLILITSVTVLCACVSTNESGGSKPSNAKKGSFEIAVIDFADIPSHNNCLDGFKKGLEDEGLTEGKKLKITYSNAECDLALLDELTEEIASKDVDLVFAISSPAAVSAFDACRDRDIPVVYAAVSDPIAAGLADESGSSSGNITGTSDELLVDHQLQLIRDIMPDAKKLGILYTTAEVNSVSALESYKSLAGDYGFEIIEKPIKNRKAVKKAAKKLSKQVDCISNLTDNTVVSALKAELKMARKAGIPVFGSEEEQVREGCIACEGVDYKKLGTEAGSMSARILKGEAEAGDISFKEFSTGEIFLNQGMANRLGITFSDAVRSSATEVFKGF